MCTILLHSTLWKETPHGGQWMSMGCPLTLEVQQSVLRVHRDEGLGMYGDPMSFEIRSGVRKGRAPSPTAFNYIIDWNFALTKPRKINPRSRLEPTSMFPTSTMPTTSSSFATTTGSFSGGENGEAPRGSSSTIDRPRNRLGVDLPCSTVIRRCAR